MRRFDYWQPDTNYKGVTWLEMVNGVLHGQYAETTTRQDVIEWDQNGIPGGPLEKKLTYE